MNIVFAGGGAPGYWFPGLTVAHQIRASAPRARVTFLGAGNNFESRNATIAGFQYVPILAEPSPGGWGGTWRFLTDHLAAHRAARRFLKRERPDVVVGLGGVTSAAGVRAAMALDILVVLLEYNAIAGAFAKKHAHDAAAVFGGFTSLREQLAAAGTVRIVGNPVRAAFARVFRARQETLVARARDARTGRSGTRQLVVLAGATANGGALNEQIPKALYKLRGELAGWKIVHQTGSRGRRATRSLYRKLGMSVEVTSFIPDVPRVLLASDLAIARPGGITLFELAAAGAPAVVVPSESRDEQHQSANAQAFELDACRTVTETDGARRLDDRLADSMRDLLVNPGMRLKMSAAMLARARPDAAAEVASAVLQLADSKALAQVA